MQSLVVLRRSLCGLALCLVCTACGMRESTSAPAPLSLPATIATPTMTATPQPSATALPTPLPSPTATPGIAGYVGYRVHKGDTLDSIARAGGSDPELILRYNRLVATPQVGRELIIPHLSGQPQQLPAPGLIIIRGNTTRPWIGLTLDCGNTYGNMGPILTELREANVQITFFLNGSVVEESPDLVRQMAADGHELANHSFDHFDFTKLSDEEVVTELQRNETMVKSILGPTATLRPYFRFPFGAYDRRTLMLVLNEGYMPVHWSLDLLDSMGEAKTPEFIINRVLSQPDDKLRGAVVLGHCTKAVRGALPELITRLRAAGYELHTLSDVLGE